MRESRKESLRRFRQEIERQERYQRFHRFNPDGDCACWACVARLQLWIIRTTAKRLKLSTEK